MTSSSPPRVRGVALVEGEGSVLQITSRHVDRGVGFSTMYEFEDVVAAVTGADRVELLDRSALERARRVYKAGRLVSCPRGPAARAARPPTIRLDRDYDLFLPVFNHPHELFALATVPDWRDRCRIAACFIMEYWANQVRPRYLLELLDQFDHVFVGTERPVDVIAEYSGRPCSYLPGAADVLRFSPLPDPPPRSIDVTNIGRRSDTTHQALLSLARDRRIHYFYDTVAASGPNLEQRTFYVDDAAAHRQLMGSILQRSRYFIANRARINEPAYAQHEDEIAYRFYEGAAAGTVMLGEAPRIESFGEQFDWPDAVVALPFDSPDVGDVIGKLDADPKRMARARRHNAHFAAARHDWVHRLRTIFDTVGMRPTAEMVEREARMRLLSQQAMDLPLEYYERSS